MFGAVSEKDHMLRVNLRKGTRFARLFLAGLERPALPPDAATRSCGGAALPH